MAMTVTSWPSCAGAFERQQGEAAVAGDEPVAHLLDEPRSEARMNSISSSTSAQGGTSARMRSMACDGIEPGAGEQAEGGLQGFDRGLLEKPRRSSPIRLAPKTSISALADGQGVRQHVLLDDAVAADEGVAADAAELVDAAERR